MKSPETLSFSNNVKKILIFMRHGEKIVKTGAIPKCGKFDSELSSLGINQSFLSGQKFVSQLKKYNFSDINPSQIHIISSPYIRTLQTTAHFLKGMESKNIFNSSSNKDNDDFSILYNISIEYGVREILNKKKLKDEIVPNNYLNFLNNPNYKDIDDEFKKFKFNIISDCNFSTEKESRKECFDRCKKYINERLINFDKNNKYKIIIIISHSGPIQFMMKSLGFNEENVNDITFCKQYYFDITEGIENAKLLEIIDYK